MCHSCGCTPCCCGGNSVTYTLQPMAALTEPAFGEGTFTPTLVFGSGNTGLTGTFTGWYSRIGQFLWYNINLNISAVGSSTGNIEIGGFPYAEESSGVYQYPVSLVTNGNITSAANTHPIARFLAGTNVINLMSETDATNAHTALTHAAVTTGTIIGLQGFFVIDA